MESQNNKLVSIIKCKDFGFGLIFIGLLFLANPQYGVFDVIPDFIGLFLIYKGLEKLSDLDYRLQIAKKRFFVSAWISMISFFLMIAFFGQQFDSSTNLTFSFFFSILSVIFLIPAFNNLFSGLSYLKLRSAEINEDYEKLSDIKVFTIVFVIVKAFLNFAPEIAEILRDSEDMKELNLTTLKISITIISFALVIVMAVYWVILLVKYFKQIRNSKTFMDYLNDRYEREIGSDMHLKNVRLIEKYSLWCSVAFIFTICFPLDGYLYIPEFMFGVFALIGFKTTTKYIPDRIEKSRMYRNIFFYLVSSVSLYFIRLVYSKSYATNIAPYNPNITEPVQFWVIFGLVIIFTIPTYYFMYKISKNMYYVRNNIIDDVVGIKLPDKKYRLELDDIRRKELKKKSKITYIIQVVYAFASIPCMLCVPFIEISNAFGLYWAYRLLLCVGVLVSSLVMRNDINNEAERTI